MNNSDKVYLEMLQKESNKLNKKINNVNEYNHGIIKATGIPNKKIEELKIRQQHVADEINSYKGIDKIGKFNGKKLKKLDIKADENNKKIEDIRNKIEELQGIRDNLTTAKRKTKISHKIEVKQRKIERLQQANVKISKKQKVFIMPKKRKDIYQLKLLSKAESKVKRHKDALRYNKQLQASLDPDSGLKAALLDLHYYNMCSLYRSLLRVDNAILDTIKGTDCTIVMEGAVLFTITKKAADGFRNMGKNNNKGKGK